MVLEKISSLYVCITKPSHPQTFRERVKNNNNNTTKILSSRDSVHKARESHLIDKATTLEPHGLNRRDELL